MNQSLGHIFSTIMIFVLILSGCTSNGTYEAENYPIEPEILGSGNVNWTETQTPDGWTMVTNEGGSTLGYSKSSGLNLIQANGYAFKDLNRNNLLDQFEDWRVDPETRATAMASEFTIMQMMGMKMNPFGFYTVSEDTLDGNMKNALELNYRQLRAPGENVDARTKVSWNNMVQAYIEGLEDITAIPAVWMDDPRSGDVSNWPGNLGLAATFNPEIGAEYARLTSEEWRAMGISMQVATQMDLATEPRWWRIPGTFGEDPALSMDMVSAIINGWQSTYDQDGNDLGWGDHSVNNQMKHWPGDGPGEGGRESHTRDGAYNVYPGGQFWTHTLPFAAAMDLPGKTESITAAMTSYSINLEANGSPVGGERVGSSYSEYIINNVLRGMYDWDGYILTDFGVMNTEGGRLPSSNFGVEDLTQTESMLGVLEAGADAFGEIGEAFQGDIDQGVKAYELGVAKLGQEAMDEIMKKSTERILRTHFNIGIVDNPYLSLEKAESVPDNEEHNERGYQAMLKSIVMLKNSDDIIHEASVEDEKPRVYIPRVYIAASGGFSRTPASAEPGFDLEIAGQYYDVLTDEVTETFTGPPDEDGNPTLHPDDIIRAPRSEIADCDFSIVKINNPQNGNPTFLGYGGVSRDGEKYTYRPISLQYRPYTANSEFVRQESISGDMIEVTENGEEKLVKENRSYFGETAIITNERHLDLVLNTESITEKVIVAVDMSNPMVFHEFESEVDAIVVGFGGSVSDEAFLEIITGQVEPSGLLPLQMPANMETVEAQLEDVPRDMEPHVDSNGNAYDFAFGLNWSGVINDNRTEKYNVPPIIGNSPN